MDRIEGVMMDDDLLKPETPRKSTDLFSLSGAEPKRKTKGVGRDQKSRGQGQSQKWTHPFMENDEFSDVKIVVNDKVIYTNKCLLAYHSPVLMKHFKGDGGAAGGKGAKGGKPGSTSQTSKDLDMSDKKFEDVYDMMAFIDPRVDITLTENDAFRLLPLAEEYEMHQLTKASTGALCQSFYKMRKGRRAGSLPVDTTLQYLKAADRYKCTDLTNMCNEECVANESPNIVRAITECPDISESIKVGTLKGKLDKVSMILAKERREKVEMAKDTGRNMLKKHF